MIKSMTGFGKSKQAFDSGTIKVEIKTFNHKYFDLSSKLPDNLQSFEEKIKKTVKRHILRGRVYLVVVYDRNASNNFDVELDIKKLSRYYRLLANIKKKFRLKDEIQLSQLLSFSDIIIHKPQRENSQQLWGVTNLALKQALSALSRMRQKEGNVLCHDLLSRAKAIEKSLHRIKGFVPLEINKYKKALKQRVNELMIKESCVEEKLQNEVALFAKNYDVTEELIRLQAHVTNFKHTLSTTKEAGKVLDFIAQELHREINTIGAKSASFKISREVIFIKSEIEKIREQIQNIE